MSRRLRWTEHAVAELAAIAEYVSLSSPVYAERLVDRIVGRLEQVLLFPESGRFVTGVERRDLREVIAVPYRVIYRIDEGVIEVLAIVHGRRDVSNVAPILEPINDPMEGREA